MRQTDHLCGKSVKKQMAVLLLGLILSVTGCGNTVDSSGVSPSSQEQKDNTAEENTSVDLVYMPDYTALELENGEEPHMAKIVGDSLYYVSCQYGDTVSDSRRSVCEYSLTESRTLRRVPVGERYGQIFDFTVAGDGGIYVLDFAAEDGSNSGMEMYLLAYDAQGQRRLTVNLWKEASIRSADIAPAVDSQGRIYLPVDNRIVLFEADGSPAGEIPLEEKRRAVSVGADISGRIYVGSMGSGDKDGQLTEVDYDRKSLGESFENYPVGRQKELIPVPEGGFLINAAEGVFCYDPDTETARCLFSWLNCDISSQSIVAVSPGAEQDIQAVLYESGTAELACMTRREVSPTEKTQLIIGTLGVWPELENSVTSYNRRSSQYHVTIRDYGSQYADTLRTWDEDAVTALNLDLVSAHDCPDLLVLANLNVEGYARNGVFEDLGPWLEQSEVLRREDYIENILDNYTYGGQLVSVPHSVTLSTLSGNRQQVGETPGWTLDEMKECAMSYPDVELFAVTYNQFVLHMCMRLGKSAFLDLEQAQCRFDSEEFQELLRFAASYPDTPGQRYIGHTDGIVKGKVLLNELTINALQDIQLYEAMYGGEMTLIGYPTPDGEGSGCSFSSLNAYAMTSRSGNKEGAWEFLEYCLCEEVRDGLPTRRSELLEKASTVEYYRDSQGWLLLGLDGRPSPKYGEIEYDGWRYQYHDVTEEETDAVLYLLETARLSSDLDNTLWNIILDEAVSCFQGQSTTENAASAIQSRISLYLQENDL